MAATVTTSRIQKVQLKGQESPGLFLYISLRQASPNRPRLESDKSLSRGLDFVDSFRLLQDFRRLKKALFSLFIIIFLQTAGATSCEDLLPSPDQLPALKVRIDHAIAEARGLGVSPVIFVDLDSTVFSHESRYLALLKLYDKEHGQNFFESLDGETLAPRSYKVWLESWLAPRLVSPEAVATTVAHVRDYIRARKDRAEGLVLDQPYHNLIEALRDWQGQGAKIVAVTAREEWQQGGTQLAIANAGFAVDHIYFDDLKFADVREYKAAKLQFVVEKFGYRPIAFFEDKPEILNRIREIGWSDFLLALALPSLTTARYVEF